MSKRIWIVGGSSGIGLELVKLWVQDDKQLIVSSQNATKNETLLKLQTTYPQNLHLINLNVSDEVETLKPSVEEAFNHYGGLDIWFYNVGTYHIMSIHDLNAEHFSEMNMTNYLGATKLMTLLTPLFLSQKYGKWVWNLSLSGYFGLPQGGGYSAPKAALLNLAESLQPELEANNIILQVINHGFVKTRLTDKNAFEMPQLMERREAAQNIVNAMKKTNQFEIRFPMGLALMLRTLRVLPYRVSLYFNKKMLP
jgi:NAD(P)-dependent dehydrogenase (short-subunit alcohol dehydrogenase family)